VKRLVMFVLLVMCQDLSKSVKYSKDMQNSSFRPVSRLTEVGQVLWALLNTDVRTDMTKLRGAFRNAPNSRS